MCSIYEIPFHINKEALFGPANGRNYNEHDYLLCCSKQPFPLIPSYLWDKNCDVYRPPTLYYGFPMDGDKIMDILLEQLPDAVEYFAENIKDEWARTDDFDRLIDPEERRKSEQEHRKKVKMVPSKLETLGTYSLANIAISNHLGIPEGFVRTTLFAETNGRFTYGVSLGSNYTGLIAPELRDKVRDFFQISPGVQPQWYLNPNRWHWRRLPYTD
ncbi:hypothetical protein OF83DRAFT_1139558 [Amylostereum chailletii]|nr:hypothetical protein OF83DRAFT_1139558 [Amylostereum chailletii]